MNFIAGLRTIKEYLSSLNLFESSAGLTNPNRLRTEVISTRIYIVLATIAVFILVLFTALEDTTQSITIQNPSQNTFDQFYSEYLTRLQSKDSTTFQCSCSQIEIPYKTLINISYKLHPVCSSVFITDSWINLLFSPDMTYYYPIDFRSSGNGQFQLLASLCLFAKQTLNNAIDDFLSDFLLSPLTLSSTSFKNQSEASAEFLKTSTIYTFRRLLNLVRDTSLMNGLEPAMQTSSMELLEYFPNGTLSAFPYQTIWSGDYEGKCFCGITSNCYAQASFFDLYAYETLGFFDQSDSLENVTGFLVGCYAFDALLQSSLICFFDSICLSNILAYFPTINITSDNILNINQTKFEPNTTIGTLANNLFIEDWTIETLFSVYYSKCAPILCIYTFTERNSFLQVLTTLLGVYGGLTVALRMCIPYAVRFWCNRKVANRNELTILQRLRNAQNTMKNKIIELNLFKTAAARTNPFELKTTKIITYVYLITMLLALSIVTIYLLASTQVRTKTIQNPSQMIFKNLNEKYMSTLQCPCSSIANSYELFTSLSPTFHPICSSLFLSNDWIVSISDMLISYAAYDPLDFRVAGPVFFNAMNTLCSLSNITIYDAWYEFSQSLLITDLVVTESEFKTRTNATIEQFQENTLNEFKRILSLDDLHAKTMYNMGYDNLELYTDQLATSITQVDFRWEPAETDTCSCSPNGQCTDVMSFFYYTGLDNTSPYYLNFTISDLQVGCYVLPSVLNSSLSCFFNQTCLDMIKNVIKNEVEPDQFVDIQILDINSTRFPPHTRIQIILDNLMIETWNENISYEKYYEKCAPEQCTYTYTSRNNPVQIITTLIGLFGGLSVALKIIVSLIVRRIRNRMRPHEETNVVTGQHVTVRNFTTIWRILKTKLFKLNLFESELSWDDEQRQRREIIITRVYLLFLMIAVAILVMYTFIDTQTKIVKILNPSQDKFDQLRLQPQYSTTLNCPCKSITVPYNSFISIKPYYHQLCSSDFVVNSSTWISLIYSYTAGIDYSYDDYRLFASPHFQLLSGLCSLANDTVNAAITEFSR
ncbi:unnamed protein product, partial [Adineta steineri]